MLVKSEFISFESIFHHVHESVDGQIHDIYLRNRRKFYQRGDTDKFVFETDSRLKNGLTTISRPEKHMINELATARCRTETQVTEDNASKQEAELKGWVAAHG